MTTTAPTLFELEPEYAVDQSGAPLKACLDVNPEVMFPEDEDPKSPGVQAAKDVCRRCDFRDECLAGALTRREPIGVWGGLTYNEREALRKKHQRARR